MLSRFFGERIGGVRFFEELDRAKADPIGQLRPARADARLPGARLRGHPPHLGRRRGHAAADPAQPLRDAAPREAAPIRELSPRWQGQAIAVAGRARSRSRSGRSARDRRRRCCSALSSSSASCSAAMPRPSASALLAVHPEGRARHRAHASSRAAAAASRRAPTQLSRKVCAARRSRRSTVPGHAGNVIIIRLVDIALFDPGQADGARRVQAADRAHRRACSEKEPGAIKVVGHTDNAPIRTARFPSNFELSRGARQGGRRRS